MQVRERAVDGVGHRRAGRAAGLVAGAEHEVVDEQLAAAVEQLRQRARAFVRLEAVLLFDANPGQLAPSPGQFVTQAGLLPFPSEPPLPGNPPLPPAPRPRVRAPAPPFLFFSPFS